jgi:hypothetical protein
MVAVVTPRVLCVTSVDGRVCWLFLPHHHRHSVTMITTTKIEPTMMPAMTPAERVEALRS